MVLFDATALLFLFDPNAPAPLDALSGQPVDRCQERFAYLIKTIEKAGDRIIVPTPALTELMVRAAEAAPGYLAIIQKSRHFRIAEYGTKAAVEAAAQMREAKQKTGSIKGMHPGSRAKAKFDRQIAAIARVESASTVYSDDDDLVKLCQPYGIAVVKVCELSLPPEYPQYSLDV